MDNQDEHLEQRKATEEEREESMMPGEKKGAPVVIKIPPQLTALKKAAQNGDPYCEVIEKNDKESE